MKDFNKALDAWTQTLGRNFVLRDGDSLREAMTATFRTGQEIPIILRPANREEVQMCLRIASAHGVPVYPVSTGKNWGLGSRVPVKDAVLMDLSRMNRIIEHNEKMAYVTIEPGVSCRQLYQFLQENESRLMVSLTGSTPDASIIGNVMERGHSKGQYADRYANVCGFEVVLPTGEFVNSGFERFLNAKAGKVSRWGVGTILEGLFTQSNLGVVTQLTIWLQPFPEIMQTVFFSIDQEEKLSHVIDTLRELRLQGTLRSSVSILNDYRVQSELGQYPWELMNQKTPLHPEVLNELKARSNGMPEWKGVWNGEFALYSPSEAHAEADRLHIRKCLGPLVDQLSFATLNKNELIDFSRHKNRNYAECRMMGFLGIPNVGSIPITYWRKKNAPNLKDMNPDRDKCGIIWCSPTVPFNGDDIEVASKIITECMLKNGFEPNLCLNGVTDRSIDITAAIIFDREDPREDERAVACYNEMLQALCEKGYIPYRLTVNSMNSLVDERGDHRTILARIKKVLDPSAILAPGRYEH